MKLKHVPTTCPYCGTGCEFYLEVGDSDVVDVAPSKAHPVSQGRLCIKATVIKIKHIIQISNILF